METKKTKNTFKVIAAILLAVSLTVVLSAGVMAPIIYALASVSALSSFSFLLYTLNKDIPAGLPQIVRIIGLLLLVFGAIVFINEALLGFGVDGYVYWTMPDFGATPLWVNLAIGAVTVAVIGGGVLFRNKLGEWFYE